MTFLNAEGKAEIAASAFGLLAMTIPLGLMYEPPAVQGAKISAY